MNLISSYFPYPDMIVRTRFQKDHEYQTVFPTSKIDLCPWRHYLPQSYISRYEVAVYVVCIKNRNYRKTHIMDQSQFFL